MEIKYGQKILTPMQKLQKFFGLIAITSSDQEYDMVECVVAPYSNAGNDAEGSLNHKVKLEPVNEQDKFVYGKGMDYYTCDLKLMIMNENSRFKLID